jgi:hypothetical protein
VGEGRRTIFRTFPTVGPFWLKASPKGGNNGLLYPMMRSKPYLKVFFAMNMKLCVRLCATHSQSFP